MWRLVASMHTRSKTTIRPVRWSKPYLRIGWFLVVLAAGAGCTRPSTTVTGKVSYQGVPLTTGAVTFVTKDNQAFRGPIDKQGNYSVANGPEGPAQGIVGS